MNEYAKSGVDVKRGYESVAKIKEDVASTYDKNVLSELGSFGAMYDLSELAIKKPVLVSGTDGVGSKLLLAIESKQLSTIGIDVVAMCVNDVITTGAKPLYFLDYLALNRINPSEVKEIVQGIVEGCLQSECSLVGGETAEMPDLYEKDHFDLAGYCTGVVEKDEIINNKLEVGHKIIGISSNGLHSNGYSLVRKIFFKDNNYSFDHQFLELDVPLIEELLKPTFIYTKVVLDILQKAEVSAMVHVTGGGFFENAERVLNNEKIVFDKDSIKVLPIFKLIQKLANISDEEMFGTFNMGIGYMICAAPDQVSKITKIIADHGFEASEIGLVEEYSDGCRISFR